MGKFITPKYALDFTTNAHGKTMIAWDSTLRTPSPISLERWVASMNKSYVKGGSNYQISQDNGFIVQVTWAGVRINKPGTPYIAEWKAGPFQVIPEGKNPYSKQGKYFKLTSKRLNRILKTHSYSNKDIVGLAKVFAPTTESIFDYVLMRITNEHFQWFEVYMAKLQRCKNLTWFENLNEAQSGFITIMKERNWEIKSFVIGKTLKPASNPCKGKKNPRSRMIIETCAVSGCGAPAERRVDAASVIAQGFGWTLEDAIAADWMDDMPMCRECIDQLPRQVNMTRKPASNPCKGKKNPRHAAWTWALVEWPAGCGRRFDVLHRGAYFAGIRQAKRHGFAPPVLRKAGNDAAYLRAFAQGMNTKTSEKNPRGKNPARAGLVEIYPRVTRVEMQKGHTAVRQVRGGRFYHDFSPGTRALGLPAGSRIVDARGREMKTLPRRAVLLVNDK